MPVCGDFYNINGQPWPVCFAAPENAVATGAGDVSENHAAIEGHESQLSENGVGESQETDRVEDGGEQSEQRGNRAHCRESFDGDEAEQGIRSRPESRGDVAYGLDEDDAGSARTGPASHDPSNDRGNLEDDIFA